MTAPGSERAKMLRGDLYLAGDPELTAARTRARQLWQRVNAADPAQPGALRALLRDLLGALGTGAWVEPPFYCDYGTQITLGDGAFVNMNCVFLDPAAITIGAGAQLGPGVQLLTATHPTDAAARVAGPELARPIGAGSVVVRDLPAGVVAVGNPCRVIRRLGEG